MYATMVTFVDNFDSSHHEGIAVYSDESDTTPIYIICGCCGAICKRDEVTIIDERTWHPIEDALV